MSDVSLLLDIRDYIAIVAVLIVLVAFCGMGCDAGNPGPLTSRTRWTP